MSQHSVSNSTSGSANQAQQDESVIDLRMLYQMLVAHKWFITLVMLLFIVVGSLVAFTRTTMYESTALIEIKGASDGGASLSALMDIGGAAGAAGFSRSAAPAEVETALIQSAYILQPVIQQLKLDISVTAEHFPIIGSLLAKLTNKQPHQVLINQFDVPKQLIGVPFKLIVGHQPNHYQLYTEQGELILKGVVGQLAKSTNTAYPISLNIKQLIAKAGQRFTLVHQSVKATIANIVPKLALEEQGENTGILQIAYQSADPEFAQTLVNSILDVAVAKNIASKAEETGKTLNFLKQQLPTVTKDLNSAESSLNHYRAESGTIDAQTEAEILLQQLVALQKETEDLKLKRLELLQHFTQEHPYMIALTEQQQVIQQQLDDVEQRLRELPLTSQQANNYQRDIEVQGGIYSNVIENMQQMQLLKASTISTVRILTTATYPVLPIASKTPVIMLVSVILGFFVAFGLLFLRQALTSTVEDPLVVEQALGMQTLAIIPFSKHQVSLAKQMTSATATARYLLAEQKPKDVVVEAMRGLRTALKLALLDTNRQIVAVSGCSPGIGKSFISSNVLALFAELGGKVLLIDADMRKGHTYQTLGGQRSPGLSDYLLTDITPNQVIQAITPQMDLIATGKYPSNPTELLLRDKFHLLLDQVAEDYDIVLIDTPPILAVTDAALILKYTAINLLVVGSGKDQLNEIAHAKSTLEKAGVALHGFVYNNLKEHKHKYGYGNKYNYYYSYE